MYRKFMGKRVSREIAGVSCICESYSNHPISTSIKQAYGKEIDNSRISDVEEISGHGVIATVDGVKVAAEIPG